MTFDGMGFDGPTHIGLVIDRSGSMRWSNPDATRDLAKWLEGVQGIPETGGVDMRVVYFDDQFDHLDAKPIREWDGLVVEPRGSTALYDATAQMIRKLKKTDTEDSRTLVVVITDGQENASTEFDADKDGWQRLQKLMRKRTKTGRWTFVFLAAELESVSSRNMTKGAGVGNVSARGMGYMGDRGVIDTRNYLSSPAAASANFVQDAHRLHPPVAERAPEPEKDDDDPDTTQRSVGFKTPLP